MPHAKDQNVVFDHRFKQFPSKDRFTELELTFYSWLSLLVGIKYLVVFLDYLTKWVEAYPVPDQRAETIGRLLVENILCRHGLPEELLSDRGANFLSALRYAHFWV